MRFRAKMETVFNFLHGSVEENRNKTPTIFVAQWEDRDQAEATAAYWRSQLKQRWTVTIESIDSE